jgi:hypothetical protein
MRFGIRCVIAPSLSEIFTENSFQNGLLPVALPESDVENIAKLLEEVRSQEISVDLTQCRVELPDGSSMAFSISDERRTALPEGLDELGQLLRCRIGSTRFSVAIDISDPGFTASNKAQILQGSISRSPIETCLRRPSPARRPRPDRAGRFPRYTAGSSLICLKEIPC